MMWKSWQLLCEWSARGNYTIPDLFGMYIFNDFHGYGMMELAENAVSVLADMSSIGDHSRLMF